MTAATLRAAGCRAAIVEHTRTPRLWTAASPARLHRSLDFETIAHDHELSGGSIMNVIRHVSLESIAAGDREITSDDVIRGIRRELAKEGRTS